MRREPDPASEDALRHRLSALATALDVSPRSRLPGEAGDVPPPARRPRMRGRVVVGVAAAAAAVTGAVVVRALGPEDDGRRRIETGPADEAPCEARDGVAGAGEFPDGTDWEVRVIGRPPEVAVSRYVDGVEQGGYTRSGDTWRLIAAEGDLGAQVDAVGEDAVVYGEAPPAATRVEVVVDGGPPVSTCPVLVPRVGDVPRYYALGLPAGANPREIRILDAAGQVLMTADVEAGPPLPNGQGTRAWSVADPVIDPDLVPLPLGDSGPPSDMVTGEAVAVQGFTLLGDWDGETVGLLLRDDYTGLVAEAYGTPAELLGPDLAWHLDAHGLVAWGPVAPEVERVVVSFDDGTTVDTAAVPLAGQAEVEAFAVTLPAGAVVTAMEAFDADGHLVARGRDLSDAPRLVEPPIGQMPLGTLDVPVSGRG